MATMLFKREAIPTPSPKQPESDADDGNHIKTIRRRVVVKNEEVTNTVTAINAPGKTNVNNQIGANTNIDITNPTSAQIEVIADKVYKALEKRLRTEKSRLGRL